MRPEGTTGLGQSPVIDRVRRAAAEDPWNFSSQEWQKANPNHILLVPLGWREISSPDPCPTTRRDQALAALLAGRAEEVGARNEWLARKGAKHAYFSVGVSLVHAIALTRSGYAEYAAYPWEGPLSEDECKQAACVQEGRRVKHSCVGLGCRYAVADFTRDDAGRLRGAAAELGATVLGWQLPGRVRLAFLFEEPLSRRNANAFVLALARRAGVKPRPRSIRPFKGRSVDGGTVPIPQGPLLRPLGATDDSDDPGEAAVLEAAGAARTPSAVVCELLPPRKGRKRIRTREQVTAAEHSEGTLLSTHSEYSRGTHPSTRIDGRGRTASRASPVLRTQPETLGDAPMRLRPSSPRVGRGTPPSPELDAQAEGLVSKLPWAAEGSTREMMNWLTREALSVYPEPFRTSGRRLAEALGLKPATAEKALQRVVRGDPEFLLLERSSRGTLVTWAGVSPPPTNMEPTAEAQAWSLSAPIPLELAEDPMALLSLLRGDGQPCPAPTLPVAWNPAFGPFVALLEQDGERLTRRFLGRRVVGRAVGLDYGCPPAELIAELADNSVLEVRGRSRHGCWPSSLIYRKCGEAWRLLGSVEPPSPSPKPVRLDGRGTGREWDGSPSWTWGTQKSP